MVDPLSTFRERIKNIRKQKGITLKELAEHIGVKEATMQRYESGNGIKTIPYDTLTSIASYLEVDPQYLLGWETNSASRSINNLYQITSKRLPVLGKIACGQPIYAEQDRESYIMAGTDINADFCLIASGDSMTGARILDGDIVFIKKQSSVQNGEIAAVIIDDEATLKRFYYYHDKDLLILKAENPKYQDMIYQQEELEKIHVIGKAVAFQSDVV